MYEVIFLGTTRNKAMQYKFSEELREKLIEYFKRKHGIDVNHETAEEWLDSMADLFILFSSIRENK